MKIKTVLFICFSILLIISMSACSDNKNFTETDITLNPNYNELFTEEELKEKGHISIIPEYDSDLSIAYLNTDGTKSFYVYTSPIRYWKDNNWSMIDTRIANNKDKNLYEQGYVYTIANSDIMSYYNKELNDKQGIRLQKKDYAYEVSIDSGKAFARFDKFENLIGKKKKMIVYEDVFGKRNDIRFYPTSLGTNCEINIEKFYKDKQIKLRLDYDFNIEIKISELGYLTLLDSQTEDIIGIIKSPIIKNKNGFSYDCRIECIKNQGYYDLIIKSDSISDSSTIFISFEMRRENQPDNAIYSNLPDLTYAYLSNYSVIGKSPDLGVGRLFIRFGIGRLFNLKSDQIQNSYFYVYNLTPNSEQSSYELLAVLEGWCSVTGNWNNNYKTGRRVSKAESRDEIKFDITGIMKEWCDDLTGELENNGVQLKAVHEDEYSLILSNDNSLYKNKTEVVIK